MKTTHLWTEKDFLDVTGNLPEDDDLARVNCQEAGEIGHECCGICHHNRPKFLICPHCNIEREELAARILLRLINTVPEERASLLTFLEHQLGKSARNNVERALERMR